MSQLLSLAVDLQDQRELLTHRATAKSLRIWQQADVGNLDASWDRIAPALTAVVTAAQVTAARQSTPYMESVSKAWGDTPQKAALVPEAFGGVMLDAREVAPAMFGAVTGTKTAIGAGMNPARAFEMGASFLATIIGAAVQDAGRQADATLATGKGYTRYVRVVSAGACSRCAILAGRDDYRNAFERHPRCRCTSVPIPVGASPPDGFHDTPTEYFESLSAAEQERVFTKSGAYAIREGANPISVTNARRGMTRGGGLNGSPSRLIPTRIGVKADGSPLNVFITGEGTTARGAFAKSEGAATFSAGKQGRYRRTTTLRLMPEQIQIMAGTNPARARELLKRYGYMDF
jgi:hypothetical protein